MSEEKYLAILILVGGKSARFGTEKGVINLFGKPLILHQIETLSKFDEDIFLVAHSESQVHRYKKQIDIPKDICVIIDDRDIRPQPNFYAPMLGIYSGFKALNELNFIKAFLLSCDMPLIKPDVIHYMIDQSKGYDCCIPRWNHGYIEPFFAIYNVEKVLKKTKENLDNQNYGVHSIIDEGWKIKYISVENELKPLDNNLLSLINVKGPIDIERLSRFYQK